MGRGRFKWNGYKHMDSPGRETRGVSRDPSPLGCMKSIFYEDLLWSLRLEPVTFSFRC